MARLKQEAAPCFECEEPAVHWHHVIPRVLGGTKTIPLCERCHGLVHSRDMTHHVRLTKVAMDEKRRRGERVGSIPYGYCLAVDGIHLASAPDEQLVISKILGLRTSGMKLRQIAETLNAESVPTRCGGRWYATQVHRVLRATERINHIKQKGEWHGAAEDHH